MKTPYIGISCQSSRSLVFIGPNKITREGPS
jgi:hypothetical protein